MSGGVTSRPGDERGVREDGERDALVPTECAVGVVVRISASRDDEIRERISNLGLDPADDGAE